MKIIFGGVRGTSSISHVEFYRYGGQTTCVLIEGKKGDRILIDAGTGIQEVAPRLQKSPPKEPLVMLITHYHLDHIIGLPSFPLLYQKGVRIQMASPRRNDRSIEDVLPPLMSEPYWPVGMKDVQAKIDFLNWADPEGAYPHRFGDLEVGWCPVHHPGGCTAYRVNERSTGLSMVFATDVEWGLATRSERRSFINMCSAPKRADLLVFDGQFSRKNYPPFKGWGHSTWEDAVDIATETKIRRLRVTHHAPQNDDATLDLIEKELRARMPSAELARSGMEIEL